MVPLLNIPVLLVTLWTIPSLFVQVIVVPALTVIADGVNAVPCMKTSFAPGISDVFVQPLVMLSREKIKVNPIRILPVELICAFIMFYV